MEEVDGRVVDQHRVDVDAALRVRLNDALLGDQVVPLAQPEAVVVALVEVVEDGRAVLLHQGVDGDGVTMGSFRCDLFDGGSGRLLAAGVYCRSDEEAVVHEPSHSNVPAALGIPADTAVLVVIVPSGMPAVWHGRALAVDNRTVYFGDANAVSQQ